MNLMELFVKIGADTSDFDNTVSGIGDKVKKGLGGALSTAAKAGAAGLAAASTAVVAFGKSAVDSGMRFDSAMSQVAATMGKPVSEIQNLRDYAQEMGSKTAFSATQAAEALNYMALAGYKDEEAMKMLPNVLNLAAAGNMDLAQASDMVTDAQSALGLSFEEAETMVDQMAKTSSTTNTSVSQLGDAILTIGATARGIKGGTAELSQVLGLLADNGIKGAEGGTHLRNMILSLQTPTKDGTEALEKLGMSYADMYDEAGNMRSLPEIFQQLQGAMEGMTQESKDAIISGIFNKTDLAAVNALVGTNKDRWDEVANAIANADGAAEAMANTQLDNLNGDVTLFKSALEGAQIAMSDKMTPTLRNFVQLGTKGLSDMTDAFKKGGLNAAMESFGTFLSTALTQVIDTIPTIVEAAATLLTAFVKGIAQNIRKVTTAAVSIVKGIVEVIVKNLPMIVTAAAELVTSLIQGISQELPNMIPVFIEAIQGIGDAMPEGIKKYILPTFGSITAFLNDVFKGDWGAAWEEIKNIFHNAFTGAKDFIVDVFGKAKDAVMTVDWLGLGQNIISTVISAFTNFATTVFDLFTTAANAVMEVDWGEVGTQIFTFIMNAFGQLVEYWTNLFTMAKNAIAEIDWSEVGGMIADFFISSFEAIKEGIMNIDWLGLGTSMLDFIMTAFDAAVEMFGTIFTDIWNYISQIDWVALGTTIWDFIISAFSNIAEWALEKFGYLADVIKTVDWVGVGVAVWDFIISAFSNIAEWALEKFGYLGDVIKSIDWLGVGNAIWDFIITAFNNIGGWALEAFGILADTIKSVNWLEVGQTIWNAIKAGVGYVVKGAGKVVQWAKEFGGEISDKIKETNWEELGQTIWSKIKTGIGYISKGVGTVLQWAQDLGSDIYDKLDNTEWGPLGTSIWTKIKTGIGFLSKGTGAVVDWAKDLASEIHDRINEKDWKGLGETITKALKEGVGYISKGVGTIIQWAIDLGGDIRDGIKSIGWTQLGTDVWTNIKSGFSSVFAWGHAKLMEAWRGITSIDWAGLGSDMWGKIKGAFSDVWSFFTGVFDLRNIPFHLPYIHVKWQDIGFLSIPHFSVRWNARGYNNPLLFQALGLLGNMGFGDLGNYQGGEIVYSHDKLMDDIREASGGGGNIITINVYQQEGEDGEALAERIGQIMNDDYSRRDKVIYA